ncbi:hypothetical protein GS464_20090 [Rhodococcus hoagii]|nr:hypothetical protein [Prescottella equi]
MDQIMAELNPYYQGSRDLYNQQLAAIPKQSEAEVKGLEAKLGQANENILQSARSRGLGFSGIPIAEQAQYAATEFAPAVARVKQQAEGQRMSILEALNATQREQRGQAQSIYDSRENRRLQEEQLAEQRRQFEANLAFQREQAAAGGGSLGAGAYLGGGGASGTQASREQRSDGGFNFTIGGKPVSAATYAQATGTPFRTLLSQMAQAGDKGAAQALGFVGNDYGYDPRKIGGNAALYNALVWGSGRGYSGGTKAGGGGGGGGW